MGSVSEMMGANLLLLPAHAPREQVFQGRLSALQQ